MRFSLIACLSMAVVFLSMIGGCITQGDSRIEAVRAFLGAVVRNDSDAIMTSLTRESRSMLRSSQPGTGIRTFSYLLEGGAAREELQYRLVLTKAEENRAEVAIRPEKEATEGLTDPTLPRDFRKNGIPIIVRKDAGDWRVDLIATVEQLVEHAPEDLGGAPPKWWPGLPYVPNPPVPPREAQCGHGNR